jgi:CheY-like chemotaxis protein
MAKILVIDDDSLVVATIRSVLKRTSHEVATASSGRDAIALLQTVDFDLALCDMIMPDMEGLETITHVKRLKPNIPVIAMSGGGRTKNMDFLRLAETMGAVDSLRKPFSGEEILKVIGKHLPPPDPATTATHAAV